MTSPLNLNLKEDEFRQILRVLINETKITGPKINSNEINYVEIIIQPNEKNIIKIDN